MIVGLATSVVELDGAVSDHDRVVIVDHVVRACSVGRDEVRGLTAHSEIAAYATELARVDQDVPVVGVAVSLESGVDVAMTDHGHVAVGGGEVGAAAYVIGVAMRVHQMRHRSVVPCANGGDHIAARRACDASNATRPSPASSTTEWLKLSTTASPSATSDSSLVIRLIGSSTVPESITRDDSASRSPMRAC